GFVPPGNLKLAPHVVMVRLPVPSWIRKIRPFCPAFILVGFAIVIPTAVRESQKSRPALPSIVNVEPAGVICTHGAPPHTAPGVSIFVGALLAMYSAAVAAAGTPAATAAATNPVVARLVS